MTTTTTTPRRRQLKTGLTVDRTSKNNDSDNEDVVTEDQQTLEVIRTPHHLRENQSDDHNTATSGKDLFSFARKRKKRFANLVEQGKRAMEEAEEEGDDIIEEEVIEHTPSKSVKRVRVLAPGDAEPTPTRAGGRIRNVLEDSSSIPSRRGREKHVADIAAETPVPVRQARRRRASQRLASVMEDGHSDDDLTEEEEEEEESDDGRDVHGLAATEQEDSENEDHEGQDLIDADGPSYQRYFANLHAKPSNTSNNTLSKLPVLSLQSLIAALEKAPRKHASEIALLRSLHQDQFPQWYFELKQGFNLLFYGYGSKRTLLNQFATDVLNDAPLVVINGFFPTINARTILSKISEDVLQYKGFVGSLQDHLSIITTSLKSPLYLLIHNIDGEALRAPATQSILSSLASHSQVHLVASIDHINAPLLWDNIQRSRYNWVWHDITTFEHYTSETTFENSLMTKDGAATNGPSNAKGVMYVLRALQPNARKIYRILCEQQLSSADDDEEWEGLPRLLWYKKAKEAFLVSNELTFKTQLMEFRDHGMVRGRKGRGEEHMSIPYEKQVLEAVIEAIEG